MWHQWPSWLHVWQGLNRPPHSTSADRSSHQLPPTVPTIAAGRAMTAAPAPPVVPVGLAPAGQATKLALPPAATRLADRAKPRQSCGLEPAAAASPASWPSRVQPSTRPVAAAQDRAAKHAAAHVAAMRTATSAASAAKRFSTPAAAARTELAAIRPATTPTATRQPAATAPAIRGPAKQWTYLAQCSRAGATVVDLRSNGSTTRDHLRTQHRGQGVAAAAPSRRGHG